MSKIWVSYDEVALNSGIVLDLPHFEGAGNLVRDVSKSRINVTAIGAPVWTAITKGAALTYDGATQYLEFPAADSAVLDFTGDYSIACWINPVDTGGAAIVMGRYGQDTDGWDTFLFDIGVGGAGTLTQRHHHASLAPNLTSNCYSEGWMAGTWYCLGISRSGLYPVHYRNGVPLTMYYEATGMLNPDSAARDLVIGVRSTKNANFYKGMGRHHRAWNRALTADEQLRIFNQNRADYGV